MNTDKLFRRTSVPGCLLAVSLALTGCVGDLFGSGGDDAPPPAANDADAGAGAAADAAPDAPAPPPPGCDPTADPKDSTPCVANELGLFVAPNGSDTTGDGTRQKPFATISHALGALGTKQRVYVCADASTTYDDAAVLTAARVPVGLYGGFRCSDWSYTGARAKVAPSAPAAVPLTIASATARVTVEDLDFVAPPGKAPGGSSIAGIVHDAIDAVLTRTSFTSGDGAHGRDGNVAALAAAASGMPGYLFKSGVSSFWIGGAGGSCTCADGTTTGGLGGNPTSGTAGVAQSGGDGAPALGAGKGGSGSSGPIACDAPAATAGAAGPGGVDGPGSPGGAGDIAATGWIAAPAGDGGPGGRGQGGGGGGGQQVSGGGSGAGGGGGCGGCGATGQGSAGGAGGASIALMALTSTVTLEATTLRAGAGGMGGAGVPQGGQPGGAGASGDGDTNAKGCSGAAGGAGGASGRGGGGAGGVSIALAYKGTAPQLRSGVTTTASTAGSGGGRAGTLNPGGPGISEPVHGF